jgi:hypothetical protein
LFLNQLQSLFWPKRFLMHDKAARRRKPGAQYASHPQPVKKSVAFLSGLEENEKKGQHDAKDFFLAGERCLLI